MWIDRHDDGAKRDPEQKSQRILSQHRFGSMPVEKGTALDYIEAGTLITLSFAVMILKKEIL